LKVLGVIEEAEEQLIDEDEGKKYKVDKGHYGQSSLHVSG
jgi:hypothetical protein